MTGQRAAWCFVAFAVAACSAAATPRSPVIDDFDALRRTRPWQAYNQLRALQASDPDATYERQFDVGRLVAEVQHGVRHFDEEIATLQRLTAQCTDSNGGRCSPQQRLVLALSLAQAYQSAGRPVQALAVIDDAIGGPLAAALPPASQAVLLKMRATLLECTGDELAAMKAVAKALKLQGRPPDIDDALLQVRVLMRLLQEPAAAHANNNQQQQRQRQHLPAAIASGLRTQLERISASLVRDGPWTHPLQLPRSFQPALASRPFHSVERHYPHLAPVVEALQAATPELASEYGRLRDAGLLLRESECIHDAATGEWLYYTINDVHWQRVDADGCSADTPVACGLFQRLGGQGVPGLQLLRAGYSSLGPGVRLHPHFGLTNTQLKFHLGLVVPTGPGGAPCAFLTVGNETQHWQQGRVLLLDDSYAHSVVNGCAATRVVFQLVFAHPELAAGSDAFAAARGAAAAAAAAEVAGAASRREEL